MLQVEELGMVRKGWFQGFEHFQRLGLRPETEPIDGRFLSHEQRSRVSTPCLVGTANGLNQTAPDANRTGATHAPTGDRKRPANGLLTRLILEIIGPPFSGVLSPFSPRLWP